MRRLLWVAAFASIVVMPNQAAAFEFICGEGLYGDDHRGDYPYDPISDTASVMLVFVGFEESANVGDDCVIGSFHREYASVLGNWVGQQARNHLSIETDSNKPGGILLPRENDWDGSGHAITWKAELPAVAYRDSLYGEYDDLYGDEGWEDRYGDLVSRGGAQVLCREITRRIYEQYSPDYPSGGLFPPDYSGTLGWELHFFFLFGAEGDTTPFPAGIGGYGGLHLNNALEDTSGFFTNVEPDQGTLQVAPYAAIAPNHPHQYIRAWVHEFGHTMGLDDGPPPLQYEIPHEAKYFYGNMNLMCQQLSAGSEYPDCHDLAGTIVPFRGIPPIVDPMLATLPFNTGGDPTGLSYVDFTETPLRRVTVHDVASGGQMYRFNLNPEYPRQEYFIIAYHAGLGLDDQDSLYGEGPLVPSTGLAIWHCVRDDMFDLESAHGLWNYAEVGDTCFTTHWDNSYLEERPQSGYDDFDFWVTDTTPSHVRADVGVHEGFEFDFFQIDNPDTQYNKSEFSWWTNPTNDWYSPDDTNLIHRRRVQNSPNTMVVRIQSIDHVNHTMEVDFLPAPSEEVTSSAPQTLAVGGGPYVWNWETSFDSALFSEVEVWFSNNGGATYEQIGDGLAHGSGTFEWNPVSEQGTSDGRLRFDFINVQIPENVGSFEMPVSYVIDGGYTDQRELMVYPNGGESLTTGDNTVRWTNIYDDLPTDRFEIQYERDGDGQWTQIAEFFHDGTQTWRTDSEGCYATVTFDEQMLGAEIRLRVVTHFSPDGQMLQNSDPSDGSFSVVRAAFTMVSETAAESGVGYVGTPYGAAVLRVNEDDLDDIFVTMASDNGHPEVESVYYENRSDQYPGVNFLDQNPLVFSVDAPETGYKSPATADINEDGQDDVLLLHPQHPRLYISQQDGRWQDVATDPSDWFDAIGLLLLASSEMAAWFDIDHDGDLDLYLGRSAPDFVFENRLDEGETPYFVLRDDFVFPNRSTRDVVFADPDQDGWWDIASTGGTSSASLEEIAPGVYSDVSSTFPVYSGGGGADYPPAYIELLDVDRDNDVDFLVADAIDPNETYLIRRDGNQWDDPDGELIFAGRPIFGLAAGDLDLDGYPDLLLPSGTDSPSAVAINVITEPAFDQAFVAIDTAAGVHLLSGNAQAMAFADFDNDGDLDSFFGLEGSVEDGRVHRTEGADGDPEVDGNWIAIDLVGAEDNLAGIGAQVYLTDAVTGAPLGWQQVSASGGRLGQPSRRLMFGLKDQTNAVDVEIVWPLGRRQIEQIQPGAFDQIHVIEQEVSFAIDPNSITFTLVVDPWKNDWRFVWYTDHWTDPDEDRVFVNDPFECLGVEFEIQTGPGVDHYIAYEPSASGVRYRHEMVLYDAPCVPGCRFSVTVRSDNLLWPGGPSIVDSPVFGKMPGNCPQSK
jgi:hypothetical protein